METLVLATGNPHKVEEIRAVLLHAGVEVQPITEAAPGLHEPAETGATFEENAAIKAKAYAAAIGRPCLADDSGLEVDPLGGAPGVISSHYATDGRDTGVGRTERDRANNARLLRELGGVPTQERTGRFVCTLVIAEPDGSIRATARGAMEGRIGAPPRVPSGLNGFGYDPLFLVSPDHERTSAELEPDEKNAISHRAAALHQLCERLQARG